MVEIGQRYIYPINGTNSTVYTVINFKQDNGRTKVQLTWMTSTGDHIADWEDISSLEKYYRLVAPEKPIFKVGDEVRCINRGGNLLINIGEIFEVLGVKDNVLVIGKGASRYNYSSHLFELVTDTPDFSIVSLVQEAYNKGYQEAVAKFKKLVEGL